MRSGNFEIVTILSLALLAVSNACWSQPWSIYVNGTAGQYSMSDLKDIQKDFKNDFNSVRLPAETTLAFPISLQAEIGINRQTIDEESSVGGFFNYAITKGRVHYSDYSGETYGDLNVSRIILGGKAAKLLEGGFALYGKLGLNYSMLELDFTERLNGWDANTEILKFHSVGFTLEPGVSWTFTPGRIGLVINTGYELNVQGKTIFDEDEEAHLLNEDGEKVILNWSGFRMGMGLTYQL